MRVYCLTSSFPRIGGGPSGRFVAQWCDRLAEAGHDVTVFYWGRGPHEEHALVRARSVPYLPAGVRHVFDGSGAPDALARQPWRACEVAPAAMAMGAACLSEPAPDLWVGHWLIPGGTMARWLGRETSRPSLVVGHSAGVHLVRRLPRPMRASLLRVLLRGPITVPSHALARRLARGNRRIEVLPMGFDAPGEPPDENGSAVLLYGRLEHIKGFDIALRALTGEGREVFVAGSGNEEEKLRALASFATFLGWVDRSAKVDLFPRCDVALFPSRVLGRDGRHEGWPVSVLEVASMGVVPFVAAWPGSDELVVEPTLQVVDGEAAAWRDALRRWTALTVMERREIRSRSIEHALRWTWSALMPRWLEVVRDAADAEG